MADMLLIKTDPMGNQQWAKTLPPSEWKQYTWSGYNALFLPDSTYLLVGNKGYRILNQQYSFYFKYIFFKYKSDGTLVDSTSISGAADAVPTSATRLLDGNILVTGVENDSSFGGIGQTGVLLKIATTLQLLWKREYRISPPQSLYYEKFHDAVELANKDIVICGRAFGPLEDSTNQNGWVIRVDSFGCLEPGCQLNSAVEDPPTSEQDIGITLSPNPTSGQVRLALAHEGAVLLGVRVLDVQGRVVSDMQFLRSAGWRECVVDLGGELAGVYVVQVRTSEGWGGKKIVKQQ
jgi:hypothetical protein